MSEQLLELLGAESSKRRGSNWRSKLLSKEESSVTDTMLLDSVNRRLLGVRVESRAGLPANGYDYYYIS